MIYESKKRRKIIKKEEVEDVPIFQSIEKKNKTVDSNYIAIKLNDIVKELIWIRKQSLMRKCSSSMLLKNEFFWFSPILIKNTNF